MTNDYQRAGSLRTSGSGAPELRTPQKLMVFVLSMALFGLANIILEIIPDVTIGVDIVMSGILFGAIPAMWLIPALHGKIEPLLGMRPRVPGEPIPGQAPRTGWFVAVAVLLSIAAAFFAFIEAWDLNVGEWEPDFLDQFGMNFLWVSVGAIVVVLGLAYLAYRAGRKRDGESQARLQAEADEAVALAERERREESIHS